MVKVLRHSLHQREKETLFCRTSRGGSSQ